MQYVVSTIFNFIFIGWTAFLLLTLWVLMPFSRSIFRQGIALWPKLLFPILTHLVGLTFELRGEENIPDEPVIFAVKHQSTWDTMFFLWLNAEVAYIMKDELNFIPFWKGYMRKSQHVVIDRFGAASAIRKLVSDCRNILDDHRSIVIFPEGTRSSPGEGNKYHPGIAALYTQTEAKVVPVALNTGLFWGRRQYLKRPGKMTVQFLPSMPSGLDRKQFMSELEFSIEEATRILEQEVVNNNIHT